MTSREKILIPLVEELLDELKEQSIIQVGLEVWFSSSEHECREIEKTDSFEGSLPAVLTYLCILRRKTQIWIFATNLTSDEEVRLFNKCFSAESWFLFRAHKELRGSRQLNALGSPNEYTVGLTLKYKKTERIKAQSIDLLLQEIC